jgi:hypothetical protein
MDREDEMKDGEPPKPVLACIAQRARRAVNIARGEMKKPPRRGGL